MSTRLARKTLGASLIWTVIVVVALCAIAAVCVWRYYEKPAQAEAQRLDRCFEMIARGMGPEDVASVMGGPPYAVRRGESVTLTSMSWNKDGYGQGNPCDLEYVYQVWTIYEKIEWVIGFDNNGMVIAKLRVD